MHIGVLSFVLFSDLFHISLYVLYNFFDIFFISLCLSLFFYIQTQNGTRNDGTTGRMPQFFEAQW
jgi:hypothetical protein